MLDDAGQHSRRTLSSPDIGKSRSMYFENAFQAGRQVNPARDRICSEAVVMADVRTNVMVRPTP